MVETMACDACGIKEYIHLIDGKDDGMGDFNRMECVRCYGPDWNPCNEAHIAGSVQPSLKPHYLRWQRSRPTPFVVNVAGGFFSGRRFHKS